MEIKLLELEKELLDKLWKNNKHYRNGDFKFIEKISALKAITQNKYGACMSNVHDLVRGFNISIETAIDKDTYFLNTLLDRNPIIFNQVEKLEPYINTQTVIKWGTKFGDILSSPSEILRKKGLCISNAVDKTAYYLEEVKQKRKNFDSVNYSNFYFESYDTKGNFKCATHNITYLQDLSSHKNGSQGCVKCSKNITFYDDNTIEYFKDVYGKFYIVRLFNEREDFYKVGITKTKGNKRKRDLKRAYEVETIQEIEGSLKEAYNIEKWFLKNFEDYKYLPLINFKGKTECFSVNPVYLKERLENYWGEYMAETDKMMCEEMGLNYEQQFEKY